MKKLAIIGAAELGSLIKHFAQESKNYTVAGFYDDFKNGDFDGLPILGSSEKISGDHSKGVFEELFIAIGYNYMDQRKRLYENFAGKIPFATLLHSSAFVDPSSTIGEGSILFPGCIVDQKVNIGNNVLLNTGVCIAHHSMVGDHCFIAPRVSVAGRVEIKERCFIGIGSVLRDMITLEKNTTVGAGSLVLKSTAADSLVFGSPAKPMQIKK